MKEKILTITLVLVLIGIVSGTTYAFILVKASTTSQELAKSSGIDINYSAQNITTSLVPSLTKSSGIHSQITMSLATNSIKSTANIRFTPTNLSSGAYKTSGLIWEVYVGSTLKASGNFANATENTPMDLLTNYELTTTSTVFDIYIWLDGSKTGNEVMNKQFAGYYNATSANITGFME